MIGAMFRLLWRFFVGIIAASLAVCTVFFFYPYLHDRMPLLAVLIILYIIIAYIGIPFLVRLWHLVLRPNHLPHYAVTGDGWSSDPVNIAIICKNERQLIRDMTRAGWHTADHPTLRNSLRIAYAILFKQPYPTAPFSNLFLFGRRQDIGFQIQTGTPATPRHRHHIRFWQLETPDAAHNNHRSFWEEILQLFTVKKQQIWIGTATHDIGPFALRIRNLQITHQIDRETNRERQFVIQTLKNAGVVRHTDTIRAGEPIAFRGQTFGVDIITDGTLQVIELKKWI
jgi:hypothetical protein